MQAINRPPLDIEAAIQEYIVHLKSLETEFNDYQRSRDLGVRMNVDAATKAVTEVRTSIPQIAPFLGRVDDTGVLHAEQLWTAIGAMERVLAEPDKPVLILGAMQSGKTTTALALQFLGPIYYLLTGRKLHPFYLLTSHTSHHAQTTNELARFLQYYSNIMFEVDAGNPDAQAAPPREPIDPLFLYSPTLSNYRETVLRLEEDRDCFRLQGVDDFVWRRAWGENVERIAKKVESMERSGFVPLMIIDEPQFGASDRIELEASGEAHLRPCVFTRIFEEIGKRLNIARDKHVFIALSATPYELHDLQAISPVRQRLGERYTGFNLFAGAPIDGAVVNRQPVIRSLQEFASEIGEPFLEKVHWGAFDSYAKFESAKKRLNYDETWERYREDVAGAVRETLLALASRHPGEPIGVCMRILNNNTKTEEIQRLLRLDDRFDVVSYYGPAVDRRSVKQMLSERPGAGDDRPFLFLVTNRARMGDAFPSSVRYFFDFAERFADLNSMMQGLIGRACGYYKETTVILSMKNALLLRGVIRTVGGYVAQPSRHTVLVGARRRSGRPTVILLVRRNVADAELERFFEELDRGVVSPLLPPGSKRVGTKKGGERRTGPILRIAEETGLFDAVESAAAHSRYFPNYPGYKIARRGDRVPNPAKLGRYLEYRMDAAGDCRFAFREWRGAAHGGLRARGRSGGDTDEVRDKEHDNLEPQILVEKFDPVTGETIADYRLKGADRRPGAWRAFAIVLPLVHPVQEFVAGDAAYPTPNCTWAPYMDATEVAPRDEAMEAEEVARVATGRGRR
jgi:hypothetical protein